jgi:hypothetical protein
MTAKVRESIARTGMTELNSIGWLLNHKVSGSSKANRDE